MITEQDGRLVFEYDDETVWVEAWGANAVRVRACRTGHMPQEKWALDVPIPQSHPKITITLNGHGSLSNGQIVATIASSGKLIFTNHKGKTILEEYCRNRKDVTDPKCSSLNIEAREFQTLLGGKFHLTQRFESLDPNEKVYGMGQYQQPYLNIKGADLELAQRNSQASVPFAVSSLGYGFLWNNPAIGRAVFGKNITSFEALSTEILDYWVVAGTTPAEIVQAYASVTGTVPMMPEYGLGFWQCKLRYQTQEELLGIAREYRKRSLPLDLIVIDYFHWPLQGEWKFDPTYWPNPDEMIRELKELNIELMVSIWPTVDKRCENYEEMLAKGYLIRFNRGVQTSMEYHGKTVFYDATNPGARKFVWSKARENYYSKGIKIFWLDEAEPEYSVYDFDNYRYYKGSNIEIGNIYPRDYAKTFYDGMTEEGQENVVNLLRCAWAGSQKYGALVWSGDIASSWPSFRTQLIAGLNMGLSGIPWWTTDIGGFHGGDPNDEGFRELFVRWFQWGAFCPVMRLHGNREPKQPQHGTTGGADCLSGAPNEVWSYGETVYGICKKYLNIREQLRDYTRSLMEEAHKYGTPVMRPCFYDFPLDEKCWDLTDQYMYGPKYLCCPVLYPKQSKRSVYLPTGGRWMEFEGSRIYEGGRTIEVECPLESMPVFEALR